MYNTTDLIHAVQRNQAMPQNSPLKFSNDDIIAFLNEELRWLIQTQLMLMDEEYFIDYEDISFVANQSLYELPRMSMSWMLNEVYYVSTDGVEHRLPRWSRLHEETGGATGVANAPTAMYLQDSKLRVFPDMSATPNGSMRVYYSRIQNLLRPVGECGRITLVTPVGLNYILTLNTMPVGHTNGVDVISGTNPYDRITANASATPGALTLTMAISDFDRTPVVGDYCCETGYTVYPHIPSEFHPVLAQAATVRSLEAGGDKANSQVAASRLNAMLEMLKKASQDRVKRSPKKIVPRNYILNAQRFRRFGWY